VKSHHVLYHQIGIVFPIVGELIASATLGIGKLVSKGIEFALLDWARKSEMTCDRAGLLACQDVDAATTAMMKMGGLPLRYYADADPAHFAEQAREFEKLDTSKLDRIAKFLMTLSSSHPWTVIRAAELQKWITAGDYERILTAHGVPREVALRPSRARSEAGEAPRTDYTCRRCSEPLVPGWRFCMRCGQEIATSAPDPKPKPEAKPKRKKRAGAQKPSA